MEIPGYRYNVRRAQRRRLFIRRLVAGSLASLLIASAGLYNYAAMHKALPALISAPVALPVMPAETVSLPWPTQGQAAIGAMDSGVLATSSTKETVVPIASVAKIITALAVMREKPFSTGQPGGTLKLDGEDISYYGQYVAKGGSVTAVNFGQELSEYDALQALLLPSSNNIADSLARWAFGSQEAYKTFANAMLKDYGLNRTHVDDASGFSPATVSTPSELIILGQKLLSNDVLAGIVAKQEATIPIAGTISNVNKLLSKPGVIGVKTGNTDEAGGCLLFAAKHNIDANHSVTVIGAITGAPTIGSVFPTSSALLDAAFKGFGSREVVKSGAVVGTYKSAWGARTDAIASKNVAVFGWKGSELKPVVSLRSNGPMLTDGQEVGILQVTDGNHDLSVAIEARDALPGPSAGWRLRHYF